MSRSTQPIQPNETPSYSQAELQPQPHPQASSLLPIVALVLKFVTLASLIVSTIIIAVDSATITGPLSTVEVHFNDIYAYRYILSVNIIGLFYGLLQLPVAILRLTSLKRLVNHPKLLIFECLGDKVILSLLATGVGAAFGATLDLKKNMDDLVDALRDNYGMTTLDQIQIKLDDFFNNAYASAGVLLIGFLSSGISSIMSSFALRKTAE